MVLTEILKKINEGVNDKGIFKAFFVVGSSGSGKSTVSKGVFLGHGLRSIDSDVGFSFLMKKAGKVDKNGKIDLRDETPKQKAEREEIRNIAKSKITKKQEQFYIQNRLGVIIDGTGKNAKKILDSKKQLEAIGYDTYLLFVDTDLNVALKRNAARPDRSVSNDLVVDSWNAVRKNLPLFKKKFGERFAKVKNNGPSEDATFVIWKQISKIIAKPPESEQARRWIRAERKRIRSAS